jgi:hypothetical protein
MGHELEELEVLLLLVHTDYWYRYRYLVIIQTTYETLIPV